MNIRDDPALWVSLGKQNGSDNHAGKSGASQAE
jgi:hypothetical protein